MAARRRSYKSLFGALAIALGAILVAGCASAGPAPPTRQGELSPASSAAGAPADEWGDDWVTATHAPSRRSRPTTERSTAWTVVLATFAAEGHAQAAANTVRQLGAAFPRLADARVHTTPSGSMVVYGLYESADSKAAQSDLKAIKTLAIADRPAFPRAMLSRIKLRPQAGGLHPHALMSARQRYPTVDPLYTLEVAVWGDFESGKLSLDEIHRHAEEDAARLRAQGYEAYFHHDDDKRLSMVTVGLFDRRAIDQRTGFYSPAVEALIRRFPAHLVNGEELGELIDRRRPSRGARVQQPKLVHVPKL